MPGRDTFADLLREAGLHPAALAPGNTSRPAPRPGLMRGGHTPSGQPYMGSPQFRARADAATAGMPAPVNNQVAEAGAMAAEVTGLPGALRANQALRASDYPRAAAETGMGLLNMLGTATALAPIPRVPRPPVRLRAGPSLAQMVDGETMPGSGNLIVQALRRARAPMDNEAWFERPMPVRSLDPARVRPTDGAPPADMYVQHYMDNPDHNPIVVQRPRGLDALFRGRDSYDVIDGHHRLAAAQRRGVPIDALDASEYFGRRPLFEPSPQAPAPMSSAPRWERATDGSVLPVRPQADRPFSRTAPTSADLREATQLPWRRLLHGGNQEPGPFRGALWATPEASAASDYAMNYRAGGAPNVQPLLGDTRNAVTIRNHDDIARALGDARISLPRDREVWQLLNEPRIQDALRARGVNVVHVPTDYAPSNMRHHPSYLFLNESHVRPRFSSRPQTE